MLLIVCSSHSALPRHFHQRRHTWLPDSSHHVASNITLAPIRTFCWRLKLASLVLNWSPVDRPHGVPSYGSITGMPILTPLLVILPVTPGVTHIVKKIAVMNHAPITVFAAMCTLPAVCVVSLCGLHLHIHETRLQVFSVNSPCTYVTIWYVAL